jgi:hypothetical protein
MPEQVAPKLLSFIEGLRVSWENDHVEDKESRNHGIRR